MTSMMMMLGKVCKAAEQCEFRHENDFELSIRPPLNSDQNGTWKFDYRRGWRQSSETIIWILCKYLSPSQTPAVFAAIDSLNIPIVRRFSYLRPREFFALSAWISKHGKFAGINRTENVALKNNNEKERKINSIPTGYGVTVVDLIHSEQQHIYNLTLLKSIRNAMHTQHRSALV